MTHYRLVSVHWTIQFTVFRFLLGKILWTGYESLTEQEEFLLIEYYELLDSNTNFDFVCYQRGKLIKLSKLVRYYINCKDRTFEGAQQCFDNAAKLLIKQGICPNAYEYFGWAKLFNVNRFVRRIDPRRKSRRRIKRFIGVGYKDKGTMKNLATDSTPSWQEVAASNLRIEPSRKLTDPRYNLYWSEWLSKAI